MLQEQTNIQANALQIHKPCNYQNTYKSKSTNSKKVPTNPESLQISKHMQMGNADMTMEMCWKKRDSKGIKKNIQEEKTHAKRKTNDKAAKWAVTLNMPQVAKDE